MMNKKSFQIAGILLLVAIVASLFYLIFSVHNEMKRESIESQKAFARLVTETADSAEFFGFMTDNFISHQQQLQSRLTTLKMLLITDSQGIVYASPVSSMITGFDAHGKPVIKTSSPFERVSSSSMNLHQCGQITITAVYSLLRSNVVFFYVRNTFLMILAITILALILIIISRSSDSNNEQIELPTEEVPKDQDPNDNEFFEIETTPDDLDYDNQKISEPEVSIIESDNLSDTVVDQDQKTIQDDDFNIGIDDESESSSEFEFPETTAPAAVLQDTEKLESTNTMNDSYNDTVPLQTEDLPVTDSEKNSFDEPHQNDSNLDQEQESEILQEENSTGLFSNATGVCWEKYLIDRLNTELSRAVETEQDIALYVIRIDHLDRLDMVSRKISTHLISQFKFRDLIFELGMDGYAVILPAASFSIAMKEAEKMYTELLSILTMEGYKKRLTIGLTLRAGRILPGERFLQEAGNACAKAMKEQDMPVVAFRADPDKYRSFIAENEQH